MELTRRTVLQMGLGTLAVSAVPPLSDLLAQAPLLTRAIPSSGERIPVVGIGTRDYAAQTPEDRAEIKEVLRLFSELGAKVIDTSTHYQKGEAEILLGELIFELGIRDRLFLATKTRGVGKQEGLDQIEQSFRRFRTDRIDLLAVHNLRDAATQLGTLAELKQAGRIRYLGITTSFKEQYPDVEKVLKTQPLDFIQIDYALNNRSAEDRILPLAADRGVAVMLNMPFGYGQLFKAVADRELPDWAQEFDCGSWAQFFLKFVLSHPAVTCAIPGMRRVAYLRDNIQAAQGRMPDADLRRRMEQLAADFPRGGVDRMPDHLRDD